jgi:DNA-binding transcriptional LysR family regulator
LIARFLKQMAMEKNRLQELKFSDLFLLSYLEGEKSLRSLARKLNLEVTKISREIQKIEGILKVKLMTRNPTGIRVTQDGLRISRISKSLLEQAEFQLLENSEKKEKLKVLTVGARGYLNALFAECFLSLSHKFPHTQFRFVDFSPDELRAAVDQNLVDIAIVLEKTEWRTSWVVEPLGVLKWVLFAKKQKDKPQIRKISLNDLRGKPFVLPCHYKEGQILRGADGIPLTSSERRVFMEAQNSNTALEIVKSSDAMVYLPLMIADPYRVHLDILQIEGIPQASTDVFLAYHVDAVSNPMIRLLFQVIQQKISQQKKFA